jgi:CHAD domain-containing protein
MTETRTSTADLPDRIAAFVDDELRAAFRSMSGETVSDQDVHDARKSLKKARAGLRLIRATMADETFRDHNLALRDAGRLLSPLRDSHSQLQLFHSFDDDTRLPNARIESALYAELSQARHIFDATTARERCRELIGRVRESLCDSTPGDAAACIDGLRRIYRKGRRALARVRRKDSAPRRHELRKQAKYLRVALEVIEASEYRDAHERARRVASWLGEDHDLAVLREHVARIDKNLGTNDDRWLVCIEERQKKLQRKALAKAHELFNEKSATFTAKLSCDDGN